jgi:hypothetical protein
MIAMTIQLETIDIGGRNFRIGTLTRETLRESLPLMRTLDKCQRTPLAEQSDDLIQEMYDAKEQLAMLLLREHAPDLTVDFLDRNLTANMIRDLEWEFARQAELLHLVEGYEGHA